MKRRLVRRLSLEQLERREVLSVTFTEVVIATDVDGPTSVHAGDFDGDGDMDVLSSGGGRIAWYENTDAKGSFGRKTPIARLQHGYNSPPPIHTADFDGDGDLDVLSASIRRSDSTILWFENADGKGSFGEKHVITTIGVRTSVVFADDVDGDDDIDVLWASPEQLTPDPMGFSVKGSLVWHENVDGEGAFGQPKQFSDARGAQSFYAADIDTDGDVDVVAGGEFSHPVWYENMDGLGTFKLQTIAEHIDWVTSVSVADIDGDGDADLLATDNSSWAWFENMNESHGTFRRHSFATSPGGRHMVAFDADGDLDLDVVTSGGLNRSIVWYENMDGKGDFAELDATLADVGSMATADINGDGAIDLLTASREAELGISWWENDVPPLLENLGDANLDFEFNQLDIVQVLASAKYITGEPATWSEGDWNGAPGGSPGYPPLGDGVFNQLDIVAAQQAEKYLTGPYAADALGVPEPTSAVLLAIALLAFAVWSCRHADTGWGQCQRMHHVVN